MWVRISEEAAVASLYIGYYPGIPFERISEIYSPETFQSGQLVTQSRSELKGMGKECGRNEGIR
jgi:hypothetical protein